MLRISSKLLASYILPHQAVLSQTVSRWLTRALQMVGIDLGFSGHSTGRASTSANAAAGVSVELIPEAADWASAGTLLPQKSDRLVLLYYRPPVEFIEPFGFVILHFSIVCLIFCTTTATISRRGVKEK